MLMDCPELGHPAKNLQMFSKPKQLDCVLYSSSGLAIFQWHLVPFPIFMPANCHCHIGSIIPALCTAKYWTFACFTNIHVIENHTDISSFACLAVWVFAYGHCVAVLLHRSINLVIFILSLYSPNSIVQMIFAASFRFELPNINQPKNNDENGILNFAAADDSHKAILKYIIIISTK